MDGIVMVILAGLLVGTCPWPIKRMRLFQYEHWSFVASLLSLVVLPWAILLCTCPRAIEAIASMDGRLLLLANLFSLAWGVANVLAMLCLVRIGVSLSTGLLTGIGLPVGVLVPLLFKGSGQFQNAPSLLSWGGAVLVVGLAAALAGVALMTRAGFGREQARGGHRKHFALGLTMACLAGLLQAGLSFSFVYGQDMVVTHLCAYGASPSAAVVAVWPLVLVGGAAANLAYPAYLMSVRRGWGTLTRGGGELGLCLIISVTFCAFTALYGNGMRLMGAFGASLGFGIYQAMQVGGSQAVGFISGEWRGIDGLPRRQMHLAIAALSAAVVLLAASKTMGGS